MATETLLPVNTADPGTWADADYELIDEGVDTHDSDSTRITTDVSSSADDAVYDMANPSISGPFYSIKVRHAAKLSLGTPFIEYVPVVSGVEVDTRVSTGTLTSSYVIYEHEFTGEWADLSSLQVILSGTGRLAVTAMEVVVDNTGEPPPPTDPPVETLMFRRAIGNAAQEPRDLFVW